MATDITLVMTDQPGELARVGQVLGQREVNIEGFCAIIGEGGTGEVHVLVEDDEAEAAFSALDEAGIAVAADNEVAVVDVDDDRPGLLGEFSATLAGAGVNITLAYLATGTRLVFGSDDLARAKALLDGSR